MKNLYLAYMWFNWKDRMIEDHEILFLVWENTDELIKQAKVESKFWPWVHVDFLLKIDQIDWNRIEIMNNKEDVNTDWKLFFWYMWAESKDRYIEDHEFVFVVAGDVLEAKKKLKDKCTLWEDLHVDFMKDITKIKDDSISLKKVDWVDSIQKVLWYTVI